ncbi:hypothetical protein LGL08_13515 [Clostridium estertheticum]|nr:hypothetical protein [Clostridium estertheticum]MBW9152960.1 hypothetical protein [Clostridium estertheticum]MCB2307041.1 hypothetical protein [Clostridium estertheticum]MCB2345849.1 hypothetical protein [Clostridium estertheticum]MCB2350559.1 hypothetical protein [Clostridium estertheticum]WAG45467.1 hypothetical protein LL127_18385 [Clostridium estertheticum]
MVYNIFIQDAKGCTVYLKAMKPLSIEKIKSDKRGCYKNARRNHDKSRGE